MWRPWTAATPSCAAVARPAASPCRPAPSAPSTWCCPGPAAGGGLGLDRPQPGPAGHPPSVPRSDVAAPPVEQVAGLLTTALAQAGRGPVALHLCCAVHCHYSLLEEGSVRTGDRDSRPRRSAAGWEGVFGSVLLGPGGGAESAERYDVQRDRGRHGHRGDQRQRELAERLGGWRPPGKPPHRDGQVSQV